jgi:hypothetical protein
MPETVKPEVVDRGLGETPFQHGQDAIDVILVDMTDHHEFELRGWTQEAGQHGRSFGHTAVDDNPMLLSLGSVVEH